MKKIILGLLAYAMLFSTAVEAQNRTRDIFMRKDQSQRLEIRKRLHEKRKKEYEESRNGNSNIRRPNSRRSGNPLIKPMKGYELYPVFGSNDWNYFNNFTYDRDSSGRITIENKRDTVLDMESGRTIYMYNSNGKQVSKIQYYYNGVEYVAFYKDSNSYHPIHTNFETFNGNFNYDEGTETWDIQWANRTTLTISAGKITEQRSESYNNSMWNLEQIQTYEYDANNRLKVSTTEYYWNGNLDDTWREVYSYDANGVINGLEMPSWDEDSSAWVDNVKIEGIAFGNYIDNTVGYFILYTLDLFEDAKLSAYTSLYWDTDTEEWIPEEKFVANYVTDGYTATYSEWNDVDQEFENVSREILTKTSSEEVSINQDYDNGAWINDYKYTQYLNPEGEVTGYKDENWNSMNNEWEVSYWNQTVSNYGVDGELLDETFQSWNSDSSKLFNQRKLVYTEWSEFEEDNISVTNINGKPFYSMYPNPATQLVSIRFDETTTSNKKVVIRDISGRVVSSTTSPDNIIELSVSKLKSGVYFVEVSDGHKTVISKLLKN